MPSALLTVIAAQAGWPCSSIRPIHTPLPVCASATVIAVDGEGRVLLVNLSCMAAPAALM